MFNNTKQHIPDLSKEVISVDKDIAELMNGRMETKSDWVTFGHFYRQLKARRDELRKACEAFIRKQKGP